MRRGSDVPRQPHLYVPERAWVFIVQSRPRTPRATLMCDGDPARIVVICCGAYTSSSVRARVPSVCVRRTESRRARRLGLRASLLVAAWRRAELSGLLHTYTAHPPWHPYSCTVW